MIPYLLFGVYLTHLTCFWYFSLIWNIKNKTPYDKRAAKNVAKYVLEIQLTIMPLCGYIFHHFYDQLDHDYILSPPEFSLFELFQWLFMIFWEDALFYHLHRLFHLKYFYDLHKLHHSWTSPIPWEALYASRTENVLINFLPVLTAPLIVNLKIVYLFLWIAFATTASMFGHTSSSPHYLHHQYFNVNYGVSVIFDKIYGTYKK